jgi:hypothetical protein
MQNTTRAVFTFVTFAFLATLAFQGAKASAIEQQLEKIRVTKFICSPAPREDYADYGLLQDGKTEGNYKTGVLWSFSKSELFTRKLSLVMELEKAARISAVRLHGTQRTDWGVVAPEWIDLQASANGREWTDLGRSSPPPLGKEGSQWFIWQADGQTEPMRFVRMEAVPFMRQEKPTSHSLSINEISIEGVAADDAAEKEAGEEAKLVQNLVINGSFEHHDVLDVPNFWNPQIGWLSAKKRNRFRVYCDTDACLGKSSLCIDTTHLEKDFPQDFFGMRQGNTVSAQEGKPFTFSFYAKALKPGSKLGAGYDSRSKVFEIGQEWQRYSFTSTFGPSHSNGRRYVYLKFIPTDEKDPETGLPLFLAGQKIWLDGLQIEHGETVNPYAESEVELTSFEVLETNRILPELSLGRVEDGLLKIDGVMDEACYAGDASVQRLHLLDSPVLAQDKTEVRLFRDSNNLYLSARMQFDPANPPKAEAEGREGDIFRDQTLELFFQPDDQTPEYYQLVFNAKGAIWDARFAYGEQNISDLTWNAPFTHAANVGQDYWCLELAIPLEWLKARMGKGSPRFNICRELTTWAPVRMRFHDPASFGLVKGLEDMQTPRKAVIRQPRASFDLAGNRQLLHIPVENLTGGNLPLICEVTLRGADKKAAEIKLPGQNAEIAAGQSSVLSVPVEAEFADLHFIEISLSAKNDGQQLARYSSTIVFMPPLHFRVNQLLLPGEPVRVSWKHFLATDKYNVHATLSRLPGKVFASIDAPLSAGSVSLKPETALQAGNYHLRATLTDEAGKEVYQADKEIYIAAENPPSWSRINAHTKALEINGQALFPYAPYYTPFDALSSLRDQNYNMTLFRQVKDADTDYLMAYLDEAHKSGVAVFIDLTDWIRRTDVDAGWFFPELEKLLGKVKTHPAYVGIHVFDEPNCRPNPLTSERALREIRRFLREADPLHICWFVSGGTLTYRHAFDATDALAYDRYATVTGPQTRNLRENYYTVRVAMDAADFYDIPMWRCLESNEGAYANGVRCPSPLEWRALAFSTLASGSRGIWLWSGLPSYPTLYEAYAPVRAELAVVAPRFMTEAEAGGISLLQPEDLVWRAVETDGVTTLVAVNLDYKEITVKFKLTRVPLEIRSLLTDKDVPISLKGDLLEAKLAPYGVIAVEWKK